MAKILSLVFFFLGSFLQAHGGHSEHVHYVGTLHTSHIIVVVAGLLITFLIYRNIIARR